MHRLALVLLLVVPVAACRRHHAPVVMPEPAVPPPPVAAAPDLAVPNAPVLVPPPQLAEEDLGGSEQPSEAEVRAQLDARLPSVKGCVRAQASADPNARYLLHLSVQPDGELGDVEVSGLPGAKSCVTDALSGMKVHPFRGKGVVVSVMLSSTGEPVAAPRDAGSRDGG